MVEKKQTAINGFTYEEAVKNFNAKFLDATCCRVWIIDQLHGSSEKNCPECGAEIQGRPLQNFCSGGRVRCNCCGKFFTALTGTAFSGLHCNYRELFFIAVCLGIGMTNQEIAEKMEYSSEAVRLIRKRFEMIKLIQGTENKNYVIPEYVPGSDIDFMMGL